MNQKDIKAVGKWLNSKGYEYTEHNHFIQLNTKFLMPKYFKQIFRYVDRNKLGLQLFNGVLLIGNFNEK